MCECKQNRDVMRFSPHSSTVNTIIWWQTNMGSLVMYFLSLSFFLSFSHSFSNSISQYYVAAAANCENAFLFLLNDCYQFAIKVDGHSLVTWVYKPVWDSGDKPNKLFPRRYTKALRRSLCFLSTKKEVMSDCRGHILHSVSLSSFFFKKII